jgi:hypothetical protein
VPARLKIPPADLFASQLVERGFRAAPEYCFAYPRRWRFDFALVSNLIAIEIEGGTWSGGRHTSGSGFRKDCEKYNEATRLGWRVYRFTSDMVTSGKAIEFIEQLLI